MVKLFMLSGEVGPEGAVIGEKGQFMQAIIFQATMDGTLVIYAGGERTASEEVMDRLAGRTPMNLLLNKLQMQTNESVEFRFSHPLPITIIPSNKVNYVMEAVE